jgi:membrane protease YdiL (CAAX protease family)
VSECGEQTGRRRAEQREWLVLAAVITFASQELPRRLFLLTWDRLPASWQAPGAENYWYFLTLLFGLALVLPARERSGFRIGNIRSRAGETAFVCALPVALAAIIYPLLPVRPFTGSAAGIWLISPLAQDLVFIGYLYGRFESVFPGNTGIRIPVRKALLISALFFSAWHLPNFGTIHPGFVTFQLFYTFAIFMVAGLSRQWTGSMLYFTLAHMAINFIAWKG